MHIRTAGPNDAAEVEALLRRAYPALMAAFYDAAILALALPAMTKANPELLASGTFYVAEEARRIVGCGGWTFEQPGSRMVQAGLSHLRHFATDPDVARRGIGRAIFAHCAAMAAERGAEHLQAFSGLNAEPFYRSLGLKQLKISTFRWGRRRSWQPCSWRGQWRRQTGKQRKRFFFEKKNQKTFAFLRCVFASASVLRTKSFLLLFFKKEALAFLPAASAYCFSNAALMVIVT